MCIVGLEREAKFTIHILFFIKNKGISLVLSNIKLILDKLEEWAMRVDVSEALKKYKIKTLGNKGNIEYAESKLKNDESVLYISPTNIAIYTSDVASSSINLGSPKADAGGSKYPGVLTVTDKRIVFTSRVLKNEFIDEMSLAEIYSVSCFGNGMTGGHIKIDSAKRTFEMLVTYKLDVMQRIEKLINGAIDNFKIANGI